MKLLFFLGVMSAISPTVFAVESAVLKEGSFIDAVEREDPALLRERIQLRLKGPFSEFVDEFFYLTESGGNIFHALAAAKTNQEKFAEIAGEFIHVFSFIRFGGSKAGPPSPAGVTIPFKTDLTDTPLFQAVRTGKQQKIAKELKNIFERGDALTALSYLSGRVRHLALLPYQVSHKSLSLISNLEEMEVESLKKIFSFPQHKTDYKGLSARYIARQSNNLPVLDVFSAYVLDDDEDVFQPAMAVGGFAMGLVSFTILTDNFVVGLIAGLSMGAATAFGPAVANKCSRAFTKKRIDPEQKVQPGSARLPDTSHSSSRLPTSRSGGR